MNDMFAGTHDGIYGAPQQSIEIPTSAGTATAVVLPFTSNQHVEVTPFDPIANVILNFFLGFAVYECWPTSPFAETGLVCRFSPHSVHNPGLAVGPEEVGRADPGTIGS